MARRRRIARPAPPLRGLHLGSEYNGDHAAAGPSMQELMARYLAGHDLPGATYFKFVEAQARCFGDPHRFRYHDVSWVRAGGRQTKQPLYGQHVARHADALARYVLGVDPGVVVIGGGDAHDEFVRQILPRLRGWVGHVVRARNPSSNGHFGMRHADVLRGYGELARLNRLRQPAAAVTHWKLKIEAAEPAERLVRR